MKNANCHTITIAAAKAGLSTKTARKYLKLKKSPSELKPQRKHRTRQDPFTEHSEEITKMFKDAPQLQANTILEYLMAFQPQPLQISDEVFFKLFVIFPLGFFC